MRAAVKVGDTEKANAIKRKLPMFLFMAGDVESHLYEGTSKLNQGRTECWRSQKHTHLNGLVMLDFDDMGAHPLPLPKGGVIEHPTPRQVFDAIKDGHPELFMPQSPLPSGKGGGTGSVLLAHVTPKGHGLRLVCKADAAVGNLADNQAHIAKLLGLEFDEACKDSSRGSFVCTSDDILYQDDELFNYQNDEYDKQYGPMYRAGNSRNTAGIGGAHAAAVRDDDRRVAKSVDSHEPQAPGAAGIHRPVTLDSTTDKDGKTVYLYDGIPFSAIVEKLWEANGGRPPNGQRHPGVIRLAGQLRYIADCYSEPQNLLAVVDGCGLPQREVEDIVMQVHNKPMAPYMPRRLRDVLQALYRAKGADPRHVQRANEAPVAGQRAADQAVDYGYWYRRIAPFLCKELGDACEGVDNDLKMGAALVAGAMFGTYLTRCFWEFYDSKLERLSFLVYVVGLPASGKSFLSGLDKTIMEPMKAKDELGRRKEENYVEDLKKRATSTKNQKEAAMDIPKACIRKIPFNTSNSQLWTRLENAKEEVDGEMMHLHLFTCETEVSAMNELGSAAWINKNTIECQAFHNEEAGVEYKNQDCARGFHQVNWNIVATGTPDAMRKKFRNTNALTGLTTRVAMFPMPEKWYGMIERRHRTLETNDRDSRLRAIGYRLEKLHGQIFCDKLNDTAYEWCCQMAEEARDNDDRVADFFRKRVPLYIVRYGIVHNVIRDLEYLEKLMAQGKPLKLRINKSDIDFALAVGDFIYAMQIRQFGESTWHALENEGKEFVPRERKNRYEEKYHLLPETFDTKKLAEVYAVGERAATQHLVRLVKRGYVKRLKKGLFKKIVL